MDLERSSESLGHEVTAIARTARPGGAGAAGNDARAGAGRHPARRRLVRARRGATTSSAMFEVPVIFITAFPERLLTGERPEPTFLITKPYEPKTVKAAISQALFFRTAATLAA